MTNTTIVELKRMARRHNRKTHIGVAQSKLALQRDISKRVFKEFSKKVSKEFLKSF